MGGVDGEGFFDASPGGARYIGYHINQGRDKEVLYVKVDQLYDLFYRPDLIAKRLEGGHEDEIRAELNKIGDIRTVLATGLPPKVEFLSETEIKQATTDFILNFKIEDRGGGVGRVVYRVNGTVVQPPAGVKPVPRGRRPGTRQVPLTLDNGENEISVTVYNEKGLIESKPETIRVHVDDPLASAPSLHVLAVGVTRYRDHSLELKYPANDANRMSQELTLRGKALFKSINIKLLLDEQASTAGIGRAFEEFAGVVEVGDVFVLYLSGHGTILEANYHFVPWELRFVNDDALREGCIHRETFEKWLARIPALKSLIILDTCHAGAYAMKGMAEKTAISKFMCATGRATIAATSDIGQAREGYKDHGVFTYALLEGLRGVADREGDGNGAVSVEELAKYVSARAPEITKEQWGYEQIPMSDLKGTPFFPIGCGDGFNKVGRLKE